MPREAHLKAIISEFRKLQKAAICITINGSQTFSMKLNENSGNKDIQNLVSYFKTKLQ